MQFLNLEINANNIYISFIEKNNKNKLNVINTVKIIYPSQNNLFIYFIWKNNFIYNNIII